MTTAEIDRLVRAHTDKLGGRPSQLGYRGFPAAVCVSRNDIVCHGVPSAHVRLADGDIVNIDVTTELHGYHGDTSATFVTGDAAPHARSLVELARGARDAGIAAAMPGARLGDIGAAIARSRSRRLAEFVDHDKLQLSPRAGHGPPACLFAGDTRPVQLRPGRAPGTLATPLLSNPYRNFSQPREAEARRASE